jgi:hypothetical protein
MLTRYAEAYRFYRYGRTMDFGETLDRLVRPLNDALDYTGIRTLHRRYVLLYFLREMAERRRSFWGWTTDEWIETSERRKKVEYQHVLPSPTCFADSQIFIVSARITLFMSSWHGRSLAEST